MYTGNTYSSVLNAFYAILCQLSVHEYWIIVAMPTDPWVYLQTSGWI